MTAKYAKIAVSTWVKKYTFIYNCIRILGNRHAYLVHFVANSTFIIKQFTSLLWPKFAP